MLINLFLFQGEYHGFAKAENKQKALDGEFYFFSKLMKFEAADKGIEVIHCTVFSLCTHC